jgi:hypothetical protein
VAARSALVRRTPAVPLVSGSSTARSYASVALRAGGSRYTEDDVERNSSERVMAAQGISADSPGRPANTGMSHSDAHEFVNAGATDGIQIWRIEDLRPVPIPLPSYGKFHTGDSYILLHTKVQKNRKEFIIHFWLGSESTIDETG